MTAFAIQHARARLSFASGNVVTIDRRVLEVLVRAAEDATPGVEEMEEFKKAREAALRGSDIRG